MTSLAEKHTTSVLPDGWRWVKLKDVVHINPRRPADIDRSDDTPTSFVPMEAVYKVTGTIAKAVTRSFGEIKQGYTYFEEGDVLFAKITPCMQNGKHVVARGLIGGMGFGTTEFHVLRPGPDVIAEWIHYFVRQPALLLEATEHFTGAVGQQRLPADYLANLDFPLPPLDEQKRITAILNEQMTAVEKARRAAEEMLHAAKALPAAFLRKVFRQPGQKLPDGWRWVRLKDVVHINPRRPADLDRSDDEPTSFVPMQSVDEVTGTIAKKMTRPFGEIKKGYTYFADGDVLFAKITPCMQNGKHVVVQGLIGGIGFGTTEFHVLRPGPDVTAEWIHHFVRQPALLLEATEHFTGAVGQQRLPVDCLGTLDFPLPPLDEQKRIAAILNEQMAAAEQARATAEEELNTVDALPMALLREAFGGTL